MNEIGSRIYQNSEVRKEHGVARNKSATNAAKELLKNGILVETNKGLVCMSLNDALNNGVGGHSLSVEDFQTVATQLLFQEEPKMTEENESSALWIDRGESQVPNKIFKQVKKNVAMQSEPSRVSDGFSNLNTLSDSGVSLEEFKDIDESVLGFSPTEYTFPDKMPRQQQDVNLVGDNKILIEFDVGTTEIENKATKSALNNRSLIVNNRIQPVISVKKIVRNRTNHNLESVLINSNNSVKNNVLFNESCISCEENSDNSEVAAAVIDKLENKTSKKRGGWPKGRKRKPEVKYEIRPPKAPATGYVIFLNKRRKEYRDLPFTEVTKLLGNEWSKLSLQEKKVYLDQAEIEKKRYREELRLYRQSDAYQAYLHKKRLKRLQGNGTEESDMDATDEIDDEDNEELYCRSCDQWFHSLHNKKEHLYGRQHLQSIAGKHTKLSDPDWCNPNMSSTSLDESSLDGSSYLKGVKEHCCNKDIPYSKSLNMDDAIVQFMAANKEREEEHKILKKKLEESKTRNQVLSRDLQNLNDTMGSLTSMMEIEKTTQILLEQGLFNLLNVPTLFYLPEPLNDE
ncbi:hypothetical protein RUM44_001448 [Polyplax serrata]|uniref:HMG box domain-containing protein n=1 Tax=Polyplax serrata TaxID=468196 RepID=A0ABR1AK18_POLSC